MAHDTNTHPNIKAQTISRKLQQGLADWSPNPLVPKAFQQPVESQALTEAIEEIVALARAPLEEMIYQQQAQIQQLEEMVHQLQQALPKLG